jgi:surface antigen
MFKDPSDAVALTRSGGGHVAFVVAVNRDGSVTTISGNYGERVATSVYRPGLSSLVGFASPVL